MKPPYDVYNYPIVIVDCFAIAHLVYESLRAQDVPIDQVSFPNAHHRKSNVVFGKMVYEMYKMIEELVMEEEPSRQVYLLFDNAKSKVTCRKTVDPSYKSHRHSKPSHFYRSVDLVQFMCIQTFSRKVKTIRVHNREADDLVRILVQDLQYQLKEPHQHLLCIANDSDWHTCLNSRTHVWWYKETRGKSVEEVYTAADFEREKGFKPSDDKITTYKALLGDRKDNIKGVITRSDITHEELVYLIETYGISERNSSLPAGCSADENLSEKTRRILSNKDRQYRLNLQLKSYLEVTDSQLKRHTLTGQNNKDLKRVLLKVLTNSINGKKPTENFSFGGIRVDV